MKGVRVQREVAHFSFGDDEAGLIASFIEFGLDAQTGGRARVADQFDEGLEGAERTPAPVLRDVAEESVLDLVPFYSCQAGNATRECTGAGRRPAAAARSSSRASDTRCCPRRRR